MPNHRPQIVFDLYRDRQITTYQSRGKAMAAKQRHPGSTVKERMVKFRESPRWEKPKQRPPIQLQPLMVERDIDFVAMAADLFFAR